MKKILLFLCFLSLFSCSSPQKERRLRVAFSTFPTTTDPRKSGDYASSTLICLIYEGFTRCLPGNEVELALAERIEVSEDLRVYTFFLREAFWSDGKPITAHDFERSWKQILDPAFPSLCAYLLFPIQNAEKYAAGETVEVGIRALDDKTLRVELERPTPHFIALTAFPLLLPVPSHVEQDSLVVNGPFRISDSKLNVSISLQRNEHFWNRDQIELEGIEIVVVPDEASALQMFEQGELDWLGSPLSPLPLDPLPFLENLQFTSTAASTFCAFNTQIPPFSNRNLRKALSYAIDRSEIVPAGQLPATGAIPPSLSKREKILFCSDPKQAKHFLKMALQEIQIEKPLILYHKPGQADRLLATALQKRWIEVLQIPIQLVQLDPKTHMEKLHRGEFQLALTSWIAQIPDSMNLLERFKDLKNPKNYSRWHCEEYSSLLQQALEDPDRKELLEKAEEILADEVPIAPLYHWQNPSLVSPRVKNLSFNAGGAALFEKCSLEKKLSQ